MRKTAYTFKLSTRTGQYITQLAEMHDTTKTQIVQQAILEKAQRDGISLRTEGQKPDEQ